MPLTVGDLRKAIEGVSDTLPVALVLDHYSFNHNFTHVYRRHAFEFGVRELRLPPHRYWFEHPSSPFSQDVPVTVFCIGQCSIDAVSRRDVEPEIEED